MSAGPGPLLRNVARLIVRGSEAPVVLGDLEESMRRDLGRGMSRARASLRYLNNALGSGSSLARERMRRGRGRLRASPVSPIDVKLAVRMLFKHPGLTGVAVFTLALGIPTSLWPFHVLNLFETPLPYHEGERIVGLRHTEGPGDVGSATLHAFSVWRETVTGLESMGAARRGTFNVAAENGPVAPWGGAWMSASSFEVLDVPPLLGRPLIEADEVTGAPDVVVLGHQAWQTHFSGDPAVIGRTVRIGGTPHTVVGVMPEGFLFPGNDHLWLPLRGVQEAVAGASLSALVFGRLAGGANEGRLLAELEGVEARLDESYRDVYESVRPEVVPFTYAAWGFPTSGRWLLAPFQLLALLLLGVACGNLGTLVLARNAARASEIAVRTALGASRARIVTQLFIESLILAVLATGLGLVIAQYALGRLEMGVTRESMPYWIHVTLTRATALQAFAVAVFCAVIAGVLPALKATGAGVRAQMQEAAGGGSAVRFGRATTALVVAEVALGVMGFFGGWFVWKQVPIADDLASEIQLDAYLGAQLSLAPPVTLEPGEVATPEETEGRKAALHEELVRRLAAEPRVLGIAVGSNLPGGDHFTGRVEVEGRPLGDGGLGDIVNRSWVVPGFFEGLGHSVRSGRDFALSDLPATAGAESEAAIVNAAFVEDVLGGGNPIGARVRPVSSGDEEPAPWVTIVGVVGALGVGAPPDDAGMYHVTSPAMLSPFRVAIHVADDPLGFAPRLREIVASIDAQALVLEPGLLSAAQDEDAMLMRWLLLVVGIVAGISVLLSVASLYALMAFTVERRTREIGLRSALGAPPSSIVSVIAKRALMQLLVGISLAAVAITYMIHEVIPSPDGPVEGWMSMIAVSAGVVFLVGVAACAVPTRRGLRIRPVQALKV